MLRSACSATRLLSSAHASGDSAWTQLLLQGMKSVEKQFLAGYLCASLYYLVEDTHSRQCLLADSKGRTAMVKALLVAGSSTAVLVSHCASSCLCADFLKLQTAAHIQQHASKRVCMVPGILPIGVLSTSQAYFEQDMQAACQIV